MAKPERYTAQEVAQALIDAKGAVTVAARNLGCVYNTVQRYIRLYPTVAAARLESHERLGDSVDLTLASMALGKTGADGKYEREPNVTALIFLAKTKFKDRGYTERLELEHQYVVIVKQIQEAARNAGLDPAEALNDYYAELSAIGSAAGNRADTSESP